MEEQLISFETAKLAKDKGFKLTSKCYNDKGESKTISLIVRSINNDLERFYPRITQSLLQRWIREQSNIFVLHDGKSFYYQIQRPEWDDCITNFELEKVYTYEEALETGLQEALKLI